MFDDEDDEMFESRFNAELERFEKMLEEKDEYYFDSEILEEIINHFIMKNQLKKAITAIDFSQTQHPNHNGFELKRAQVYTATGKLKESLLILQNLEKTEPFNGEVLITKANVFSQLKDPKNAIRYFEKAIELVEKFDDIVEYEDVLFDLSMEYQTIHDYNNAIRILERILLISPDNESAIYEIAYCYERLGDFDKCIEFYNKYIDNNPYSFTAWYNLGNIYYLKNNIEKALWAYDYAVIINDDFSSAHFNMGNTYMQIEKYDKAIESYSRCLEIDGEDALTHCYIAEAYERLEAYDTALQHYFKSKQLNPELSDAWLGIGIVTDIKENTKEAIPYLERAVNLAPDNANYRLVLAEALVKMDQVDEAKMLLEDAINLEPDYDEAIELLAKLIAERDDSIQDAINFLESLENLDQLGGKVRVYLAALYYKAGKKSESIIRFQAELISNEKAKGYLFEVFPEAQYIEEFIQIIDAHNGR